MSSVLLLGPKGADFWSAAAALNNEGHTVSYPSQATMTCADSRLRFGLKRVLEVQGVALLTDWMNDATARTIHMVAVELRLPVMDADAWLTTNPIMRRADEAEDSIVVNYNNGGSWQNGTMPQSVE